MKNDENYENKKFNLYLAIDILTTLLFVILLLIVPSDKMYKLPVLMGIYTGLVFIRALPFAKRRLSRIKSSWSLMMLILILLYFII